MARNHETTRAHPHPHPGRAAPGAARRGRHPARPLTPLLRSLIALAAILSLALAAPAGADSGPHYDVPQGYTRCPHARAWHGFFKWASVERTSCGEAARMMRAYAAKADKSMPRSVDGYRCRIHYWRNEDGDIYASRHTCTRDGRVVRFYGMV